ncbi:MAG: VWA domain-containing protein [Bacteroidota bacterium]
MRKIHPSTLTLIAALLIMGSISALRAQNLPIFNSVNDVVAEKGQHFPAVDAWQPSYPMFSTDIFSENFNKSSTQWATPDNGWKIANGRAQILGNQSTSESYLVSPAFVIPQGKFKLKYQEKYSLESHYDFGSVWITKDNGINWRKVHTITGVAEWRDTYIDLRAYQNETVKFAFVSKADDLVNELFWQIDNLEIVEQTKAAFPQFATNTRVSALAAKLQNSLNAILTGREINTFPTISATVRVEDMPNLTESDFKVCENGEEQIEDFNVILPQVGIPRPADIVFIIDNSGSMGDEQIAIQNSITAFVDDLEAEDINANLGLTRFGQSALGGNPIIENDGQLSETSEDFLDNVFIKNFADFSGGTEPGLDAILASVSQFNFRTNSQKYFILITDEDNDGLTEPRDVLPVLQQQVVTLYSVINANGFFSGTSQFDYGDLAIDSGGDQYDIVDLIDPSTLQPIIDDIKSNIATEDTYIVSYKSSNRDLNGIERVVDIKVTSNGESDTVTFMYTPGAAPLISLAQSTLDLIANPQPVGDPITIQANITDLEEPFTESAILFYRTTGEANYAQIEMTNVGGDLWEATIPASFASMPGVDLYITATDGISTTSDRANSPAQNPYQIAINPNVAPIITSTPVNSLNLGEDLAITAEITDNTNEVASASLFYRGIGEPLYQEVSLNNTGRDNYEVTVNANDLSDNGVQYYIRATDDFGVSSYFGEPQTPIVVDIIAIGQSELVLSPASVTVDVNKEVCVTAKLTDENGDPIDEEVVSFEVTGTNTSSASVETDENGEVEFCYIPTTAGNDIITASAIGLSDQTSVTVNSIVSPPGQRVSSFTLVNAETDQDIRPIASGDIVYSNGMTLLDIRANTDPGQVGSVQLELSGPLERNQLENLQFYSLFGDNPRGDYNGAVLPSGDYTLIATPYSERNAGGDVGTPLTIQFEVINIMVDDFTLVNSETDQDIQPLMDGDIIDLTTVGEIRLDVRAGTTPNRLGSVQFELEGPVLTDRFENLPLYSLFGDNPSGDYQGEILLPGEYTLTATPYSERNGNGFEGASLTVQFEVVGQPSFSVQSFTLVNAETDQDIQPLEDGDEVNLGALGDILYSARANTSPGFIGSVVIELDGPIMHQQIENRLPYSLFGDNPPGEYSGEFFPPGSYALTATPYSAMSGQGFTGDVLTVEFTVVDGSGSRMASVKPKLGSEAFSELSFSDDRVGEFRVFPIPSSGKVHIVLPDQIEGSAQVSVYDALGKTVHTSREDEGVSLDLRPYGVGVYFVRLLGSEQTYTQRILIE